ncbi:MAG TPA: hypothetical protein DDW71_05945 [Lactobacillus sp.]|nr:hypothetical protein [Lactobacillus sp.]
MLIWEVRGVNFVINMLLLTGFSLLYTWLQHAEFHLPIWRRLREASQIALTIGFLLLYHLASELRIMEAHDCKGLGWSYLAFQIGVLLFAMILKRSSWLFLSLSVVLLFWYWWLPNVSWWGYFYVVSVLLLAEADRFGWRIIDWPLVFYPFCLLFSAPFLWANWISLRGIEVSWWVELAQCFVVYYLIWLIYYQLKRRDERQAILLCEASKDNLTKLNNFRIFNDDLQRAFAQYHEKGTQYSLYTFDIDFFKRVNDRYGHLEGNAVLKGVATELNRLLPKISSNAKAYRVGGEEFSFMVFDDQTQHGSPDEVANQVREAIGKLVFKTKQGDQFQITISLGQAQIDAEDQNYLDIYKCADQRLYRSKEAGRNRVTTSGKLLN